jgi:aminoglycoside phosphotransferase
VGYGTATFGYPWPDALPDMIDEGSIAKINGGRHYHAIFRVTLRSGEPCILKIEDKSMGTLFTERQTLLWLEKKLPVPKVHHYSDNGRFEYLLMTWIDGQLACDYVAQDGQPSLGALLGEGLARVHRLVADAYPTPSLLPDDCMELVRHNISTRPNEVMEVAKTNFAATSLDDVLRQLEANKPQASEYVFAHGDYGLGNVLIRDGQISAFIDFDCAGLADPYYDIYYALQSFKFNQRENEIDDFLAAYGVDELPKDRMRFHHMLDLLLL